MKRRTPAAIDFAGALAYLGLWSQLFSSQPCLPFSMGQWFLPGALELLAVSAGALCPEAAALYGHAPYPVLRRAQPEGSQRRWAPF